MKQIIHLIKSITLLSLLFSFPYSFSQNHIEYHKEIIKAEREILDSNYIKAIEIYDAAFKKYDKVLAKNCYTAAQTAIVAKDFEKAFYFMERGFAQGLKLEIISQDSILIMLKQQEKWTDLERKYDSLHQVYRAGIDWEYRQRVNTLTELDQTWRDKHEEHPWNFLWRPFIWIKWSKITKRIVEDTLVNLIQERGYPGEKLIGLPEIGDYYKQTFNSKSNSYALFIFIHYYSKPRDLDFIELCKDEIRKGNLEPDQFASIVDFQAQWGKGKYYKGLHYNQWHKSINEADFPEIDRMREEIGLDSIEEHEAKTKRGLKICKLIQQGKYQHINLFVTRCG